MEKNNPENIKNVSDMKDVLLEKLKIARKRWEKIAKSNELGFRSIQGDSDRSHKKHLIFVKPGSWWNELQAEINELEAEIQEAGFVGRKKPRCLWLPLMIENASEITIKAYQAKSVKPVSVDTALDFASKARGGRNARHQLVIRNKSIKCGLASESGRNYQLRVISTPSTKHKYLPFSRWTFCLCPDGKMPKVNEDYPEYTSRNLSKIDLCTSKNNKRVLFERENKNSSMKTIK